MNPKAWDVHFCFIWWAFFNPASVVPLICVAFLHFAWYKVMMSCCWLALCGRPSRQFQRHPEQLRVSFVLSDHQQLPVCRSRKMVCPVCMPGGLWFTIFCNLRNFWRSPLLYAKKSINPADEFIEQKVYFSPWFPSYVFGLWLKFQVKKSYNRVIKLYFKFCIMFLLSRQTFRIFKKYHPLFQV